MVKRFFLTIAVVGVVALCSLAFKQNQQENKNQQQFTLYSTSFEHNNFIPAQFTCDGENISPDLHWEHAPVNAKSFALIVDDPDAPTKSWVHWVLFNIPADIATLRAGEQPSNFVAGRTDFPAPVDGVWRYGGPCPPSGVHHYHFTLYALDSMVNLPAGSSREELLAAMQGHVLAKADLIGLYEKKK